MFFAVVVFVIVVVVVVVVRLFLHFCLHSYNIYEFKKFIVCEKKLILINYVYIYIIFLCTFRRDAKEKKKKKKKKKKCKEKIPPAFYFILFSIKISTRNFLFFILV